MDSRGVLLIISGPSGSGKGTVAEILTKEDDYFLSISAKYLSEKVDTIIVRVPKGKKAEIQKAAKDAGISVSSFCALAIDAKLKSITENNYDS